MGRMMHDESVKPIAILEAASRAHRLEVYELEGRLERAYAVMRDHGIPLPNEDEKLGASGAEHLDACRDVVLSAYELLESLERLKHIVGSGMEFVGAPQWRG